MNIQGLSNKIDQIRLLLMSEQNQIQVFGLSESKLNDLHPDSYFEINGYQKPFRRDRGQNAGGGLLVYVKDGVCCKRRPDLENERLECIWLEVKPTKSKSFLIGHIYRPPNSSIVWNELFEECLENVLKEEKEMYILGDINRDLLNNQINKAWTDYIEPFGITQLVSEPTRVTNDSRTLIDHIYSNCPENVNSIDVPKIGLSDHFPIFFTRKMHVHPPKGNHFTISYRSFKDFDEAKFFADLQAVPWDVIQCFDDINDILEAWTDLFLEVVDRNVPLKQHRVKRRNQPDWITPDILDAIKCRDRYKSVGNENDYKYWRNKVVSLIRRAKQEKYETYIEINKGKPGSIYKIFQEVGAGKGCQKQSNIYSVNTGEGLYTEDSTEIANAFNNFFVNIASKIKEPISNSSHDKLKDFCRSKLSEDSNFKIPCIEKDKVFKYLSNIDVNKATGMDNIGPRLIKLAAPIIAGDITFICNYSISNSSFPDKWKEAKVSPLHKNGPHDEINNYRPISILPILSKVLEQHVSDSLTSYLNENNLLHQTQSGFRSHHSCETALTHMVDSWLSAIDSGKMVGVTLVDFKKAFDLVDHDILLTKLEIYGIRNETLLWFKSYLMQRQQQVTVNNGKSDIKQVSCGVPQGSILGPLLFLLFINDLPLHTSNVFTDMYADDTTLYYINASQDTIEQNLQLALNKLHTWCKGNGMVLNSAKTKVMLITSNQKRQRLNT
ncbi:MAG: reverse transcriptase family protein, partial [Candidatus Thiodiazotropha sp.]